MEDITVIDLISELDSRITTPKESDDIKKLTEVRDTFISHIIKQYRSSGKISEIPMY